MKITSRDTKLTDDIELTPDYKKSTAINWFPGHMVKAIRQIKEKIKLVDIVVEVRDARAPLASGNRMLEETLRQKSRLILLNKTNLADQKIVAVWEVWFKENGVPFIFVNCFDKPSMKKVVALANSIVAKKRAQSNPESTVNQKQLKMMIIGLPNTGKSTIINQLAGRSATKTADRPGQTKVQQWIEIDKNLKLLDTPGVMPPSLAKEEHGYWLSAIHAIPDEAVGEEIPARFLIQYFKDQNKKEFKEKYKIESLEISIDEILEQIATLRGCIRQKGLPDLERVYKLLLIDFRAGDLGKCCFGLPPKTV